MKVIKRDGKVEDFKFEKIKDAVIRAFNAKGYPYPEHLTKRLESIRLGNIASVEGIQNKIENILIDEGYWDVAKAYAIYRERHKRVRDWTAKKKDFINKYKESSNTANATVDDNSNVSGKNIGILNSEIHKEDNILINRAMIDDKLKELYPNFNHKMYSKSLENHIIYKHDESSFAGAISPYCASTSMYPFLLRGIKDIGGLSAAPKNLDSYCGMYINMVFALSAQFAGAVATSEALLCYDWFARKEWGDNYYDKADVQINSDHCLRYKSIKSQIHQYFQQIVYSINQPSAARGVQSAFVNFSIFDKAFFEGMFGNFKFPDGESPKWESFNWLQKEFLHWFNQERLKCILTFPVVSTTLLYKDGKFVDEDMFDFVCEEYAQGNSFFTYISDSVDSLSSCCRLRSNIRTKEFNFTNGNIGVMTGSKSVISINFNRLVQMWADKYGTTALDDFYSEGEGFLNTLDALLEDIYKYQEAYDELLWDMYNADLLPAYKAGFINLNKQYLTIGIIGLTAAAEFLGIDISDNPEYQKFCTTIFGYIKKKNEEHKTKKLTFNTEMVPAESAGVKLYNADKADGYWVPEDINLYTSYMFKPYEKMSVFDRITLHGKRYIGDYLDGGAACHINLDSHLSKEQYKKVLKYAAEEGCNYLTFNVPNSECKECGYITKVPIKECPKCSGKNISLWDRIIG